jgi:hypothetical protein
MASFTFSIIVLDKSHVLPIGETNTLCGFVVPPAILPAGPSYRMESPEIKTLVLNVFDGANAPCPACRAVLVERW